MMQLTAGNLDKWKREFHLLKTRFGY